MAITAFTGAPGMGKSYALVEQVIVPAVMAGRRVVTNVEGVDPAKVDAYCIGKGADPDKVGEVVLFHGEDAHKPDFFPTEANPIGRFIRGGDLLVFDEWRLYWSRRGKLENPDLEPFLRWHRHLTDENGVACDVAIASQLPTDVHQDFRGLIEYSYKFKKLKAVGLNKAYAWDVYEGHLQPKGGAYAKGNGTYKDEITALYRSYSTDKKATELVTDKRRSVFGRSVAAMVGTGVLAFSLCVWAAWRFFSGQASGVDQAKLQAASAQTAHGTAQGVQSIPPAPPKSDYRIVGHINGDRGVKVVISDQKGGLRILSPEGFDFDGDRPTAGLVDGKRVVAEDRIDISAPTMIGVPGQLP